MSNDKNGWLGYKRDDILPSHNGDYFISHEIRIHIKQPVVKLFHKGIKIGHEYPFAHLRAAILLGTWFGDDPGPLIAWKGFVNKVLQLVSFKLKAIYYIPKKSSKVPFAKDCDCQIKRYI